MVANFTSPVLAEGTTFTYAIGGDTGNTLNPMTADDRYGLMATHLAFSPAYYINPDSSIHFILAESLEPSEDGLTYTMKLKKDLKWSDGEPLTADDIVYTYEQINKKGESMYIDGKPIEVVKEDDRTVVFKLPAVSASVVEMLVAETSVLPKHYFEGRQSFDVNMLEDELVGSGPYKLTKYETGQYLKFEKNPYYANEEAKIDTVILRVIENSDTAALALQNGEIMLAGYTDDEFFDLSYSFLPASNEYYTDDVEKYEQDLDKAKELTASGPKDLKLAYIEEDPVQSNQVLAIQAQLKKIGINVELVGMNGAAYMGAAYDNENTDYDIFMGRLRHGC